MRAGRGDAHSCRLTSTQDVISSQELIRRASSVSPVSCFWRCCQWEPNVKLMRALSLSLCTWNSRTHSLWHSSFYEFRTVRKLGCSGELLCPHIDWRQSLALPQLPGKSLPSNSLIFGNGIAQGSLSVYRTHHWIFYALVVLVCAETVPVACFVLSKLL